MSADTEPFECELEARGEDEVWVLPHGDLDLASGPELRESVSLALASEAKRVVLDLRGLDFMDSTGLKVIVDACQGPDAPRVQLVQGGDFVQRVFRVSGLLEALPFRDA